MKKIIAITLFLLLTNISYTIAESDSTMESYELPPTFSWRDIDGIDFTTSVKDQRPAPTCEAYALVAALETLVQYQVGYPFDCDLSELHLFFYSGGTNDWGVNVTSAADYLIEYGVPDEGCFPDPHRAFDYPFESLQGWENRTVKIMEWGWVENDVDSIKHALVEHGPLVICMLTRTDFFYYRGGIYTPRGNVRGGHVITITGYDDIHQCWEIKNTGGDGWGEDGYIRVSYDADTPEHPFFWPFYGGTGIMYIDGVSGNFKPDIPKIRFITPEIYQTYFFGHGFSTLFKNLPIQLAAPRIIGKTMVELETINTDKVEFYLDNQLMFVDEEYPFTWELNAAKGLHTLETFAYNDKNMSKDTRDVFILL